MCGCCWNSLCPETLMWLPNLLQNYLPSQENMPYNQFIKMMIIFSIAFITVLIFKVSGPLPCGSGRGGEACWAQACPCQAVRRQGHVSSMPPLLLLAPFSCYPMPAPLTLLGILRDSPFRGYESMKATCVQMSNSSCPELDLDCPAFESQPHCH